jgi:hypothetical protein
VEHLLFPTTAHLPLDTFDCPQSRKEVEAEVSRPTRISLPKLKLGWKKTKGNVKIGQLTTVKYSTPCPREVEKAKLELKH